MNETPTKTLDFDALIAEAAARTRLEPAVMSAVATGALGLLEKHASPELMKSVYQAIPGVETHALSDKARPPRGGLFGGLMRNAGGLSGAAVADAMGLADSLAKGGVDRAILKRALPALRDIVREKTGRDLLGEAIRSVPGVGGLLGAD